MLKDYLLSLGCFIDNNYLDQYLELVQNYQASILNFNYVEAHHAIPVAYYRNTYKIKDRQTARRNYADKDIHNFKISMLFKDHCKAHWLLFNCTTGKLKGDNAKVFIRMTGALYKLTDGLTAEEYAELQANRDLVKNLDFYYWSDEDLDWLIKNYLKYSVKDCSQYLQRSEGAIRSKAIELGMSRNTDLPWTKEQKQQLVQYYISHTVKECAIKFNRTETAIWSILQKLSVIKKTELWTADQIKWLKINSKKYTLNEIAIKLNKTWNAVQHKCIRLKLKHKKDIRHKKGN